METIPEVPRPLLTLRDTARQLGVSEKSVRELIRLGRLRAVRLPPSGRFVRVDPRDLEAMVEAAKTPAATGPADPARG